MPENVSVLIDRHEHSTAIFKLYDAQCEWWLERVVRKTLAPKE